jgi:NADH-quinone oxidoreductase subunit M
VTILHFPWLEATIATPLLGALLIRGIRQTERIQQLSVLFSALTLVCALGVWIDFGTLHTFEAHDRWDLVARMVGDEFFVVDELSAPLIPMAALVFLATAVATMRSKARRFSFSGALISEAILLATLCCRDPWGLVVLLIAGIFGPGLDLYRRRKPLRVYVFHMTLFATLLVAGQWLVGLGPEWRTIGVLLLLVAVLLRSGVCPLHCWMTDLFEHASLGTSLLFITPLVGAYAAIRLVFPIAPAWALTSIALASVITALYAAGMALVQTDARRFYCFLLLSHSSLVLVGVEIVTPVGLAGALSVWLSATLALSGLGLTLRMIEARQGRVSLTDFHGLAVRTPLLAAFFLLTGLASVGFPGTFGFVGMELLINGVIGSSPFIGTLMVLTAMLNGISILQVYFRIFTGSRHLTAISLGCRPAERLAVLSLTLLILIGGLYAQPGISSRYHAAIELLTARQGRTVSHPEAVTHHPSSLPGLPPGVTE